MTANCVTTVKHSNLSLLSLREQNKNGFYCVGQFSSKLFSIQVLSSAQKTVSVFLIKKHLQEMTFSKHSCVDYLEEEKLFFSLFVSVQQKNTCARHKFTKLVLISLPKTDIYRRQPIVTKINLHLFVTHLFHWQTKLENFCVTSEHFQRCMKLNEVNFIIDNNAFDL
jgi:hypothetical protein